MTNTMNVMNISPEVSICCLTYNHEKFIKKTLEGFVRQKTNFPFEIIVYDDCSTDGTVKILKSYAEKYPDLFRLFLSDVNNYPKDSGRMWQKYLIPHVRGRYIADCEGDDYWCDNNKLQKQYDIIANNPDISCCFHDAKICDADGKILSSSQMIRNKYYKQSSGRYSCDEVLKMDFYPSASLFYKSSSFKVRELPSFFENRFCGDLPWRIYLANEGDQYCINESMSVYRIGNKNSASGKIIHDKKALADTLDGHIQILMSFDRWSNYKHHNAVDITIKEKLMKKYILTGDIKKLHSKEVSDLYNELHLKQKFKCYLIHYVPAVYYLFEDIKRKLS